jgi:hypothetical protein
LPEATDPKKQADPLSAKTLRGRAGCGSSEAPALGQAVDLLREVGGFLGLLRLDAAALRGLGLTRCKAAALVSALELYRRAA